jgi:hypothetical protein
VRDEQTHPHRPRLVVSHSTCPPLSSSPHANSFVIGPAVIKHTHAERFASYRNDPAKIAAEIESIASSAASMALEEGRAEVKRLKTEMYVMKIQEQAKVKPVKLTEKQIFHNNIVGNPVVVGAVSTMKEMDPCTLWWIVQWGNEYLARFKASATVDEVGALESYKTWTQTQKAKRAAGFTHSTKSESHPYSAQKATPAKDSPFFDSG